MAAEPFPDPWGFSYITGNNTNIFKASIEAWKLAGTDQIILDLVIGALPITLMIIVYIRTQKIGPSLFASMFSVLILYMFDLMSKRFAAIIFLIEVLLSAAFFAFSFRRKR